MSLNAIPTRFVLAVFPINAVATGTNEVGLALDVAYPKGQTYAIVGDEVIVTVSLTENTGVASMFLTANYDTAAFELVSAELKTDTFEAGNIALADLPEERISFGMVNTGEAGKVIFNWIYSGALNGSLNSERNCEAIGAFAEFKLKVKNADLEDEKYKVTVTPDPDNFFTMPDGTEISLTGLTDDKLSATVDVKKQYSVTYDANGGENAPAAQTKIEGIDLTLSSDVPTRGGYKFLGWATSNTASTKEFDSGDTSFNINDDTTLFAVWQRNASTLAIGESVGVAGGTVIVPVTVGGETMSAKNVELTVTAGDLTFNGADDWTKTENKISKTFNPAEVFQDGSKLVNLKFEIPQGAEINAKYTVSIAANIDDNFAPSATDGKVTVAEYILGDVNGDGIVDLADCMILKRHVAKWNAYKVLECEMAADVNDDGNIDLADCMILKRHVAKWNAYKTLPYKG